MVKGKKGNLLKKKKGQNMVLEYGMDGTVKKLSLIRVLERCKKWKIPLKER
jgi:hypothetical protein